MTTTEEMLEGIALKLWWGWIPKVSMKKWLRPGIPQKYEQMSLEEARWFNAH